MVLEGELFPTQFSKNVYNQEANKAMQAIPVARQQQDVMMQNPFDASRYGNIGIPDTPINYSGGMVEALLGDQGVPDVIKIPFWYAFSRDLTLGFVDKERKEQLMLNFDIIKIDELNALPYYDYTFEAEKTWNIIRNVFESKLNRAYGFKGQNVKNERIILQSQFSEQRQISEDNSSRGQDGFFKRLLGRR